MVNPLNSWCTWCKHHPQDMPQIGFSTCKIMTASVKRLKLFLLILPNLQWRRLSSQASLLPPLHRCCTPPWSLHWQSRWSCGEPSPSAVYSQSLPAPPSRSRSLPLDSDSDSKQAIHVHDAINLVINNIPYILTIFCIICKW